MAVGARTLQLGLGLRDTRQGPPREVAPCACCALCGWPSDAADARDDAGEDAGREAMAGEGALCELDGTNDVDQAALYSEEKRGATGLESSRQLSKVSRALHVELAVAAQTSRNATAAARPSSRPDLPPVS